MFTLRRIFGIQPVGNQQSRQAMFIHPYHYWRLRKHVIIDLVGHDDEPLSKEYRHDLKEASSASTIDRFFGHSTAGYSRDTLKLLISKLKSEKANSWEQYIDRHPIPIKFNTDLLDEFAFWDLPVDWQKKIRIKVAEEELDLTESESESKHLSQRPKINTDSEHYKEGEKVYQELKNKSDDINKDVSREPEISRYVWDCKELPKNKEMYNRMIIWFMRIVDLWEDIVKAKAKYPDNIPDEWELFMIGVYEKSAMAREYFKDMKEYHSVELLEQFGLKKKKGN